MDGLHEHLRRAQARAYRQLARSLDGLSDEDAARGADPGWRTYRFGVGLDGSIRGIVRHVALWKGSAADGLASGAFPSSTEASLPDGWPDLLCRLEEGHCRLSRALEALAPADLELRVTWEGESMRLADLFAHLAEHDLYHAGQVNLLRQQMGHCLEAPGRAELGGSSQPPGER